MSNKALRKLGIDIGSTTVKVAILDEHKNILFSDYQRHFANIQETLANIINDAYQKLCDMEFSPVITGSGGLTISKHLDVPFVQEVVAVSTALKDKNQKKIAIKISLKFRLFSFDKGLFSSTLSTFSLRRCVSGSK